MTNVGHVVEPNTSSGVAGAAPSSIVAANHGIHAASGPSVASSPYEEPQVGPFTRSRERMNANASAARATSSPEEHPQQPSIRQQSPALPAGHGASSSQAFTERNHTPNPAIRRTQSPRADREAEESVPQKSNAAVYGIDHEQPAIDVFLQVFKAVAEAEEEKQEAAYKSLGRTDPAGLQSIDRRVLMYLHPDKHMGSSNDFRKKLNGLRDGYRAGRQAFLRLRVDHQSAALLRNELPAAVLEVHQYAGSSTYFHYDPDTQYHPTMGDIFYDPQKDKSWRTPSRMVPGNLENSEVPAGYIHAHFREYKVEGAREKFIALCLNATPEELNELDAVRAHAEAVLLEDGEDIGGMRDLINACEVMQKREYLKSLGVWERVDDPKVKERVDGFLAAANIRDIYQLARYIVPACKKYPHLPAAEVVEKARQAQLEDDAGDRAQQAEVDQADQGPPVGPGDPRPPKVDTLFFGGMGSWT